jgi:hypothetical protein
MAALSSMIRPTGDDGTTVTADGDDGDHGDDGDDGASVMPHDAIR